MIFRNQTQVLEQIINLLFYIAEADGEISKPEIQFIEVVLNILAYKEINTKAFNLYG